MANPILIKELKGKAEKAFIAYKASIEDWVSALPEQEKNLYKSIQEKAVTVYDTVATMHKVDPRKAEELLTSLKKENTEYPQLIKKIQLGGERPLSPGLTLRTVTPEAKAKQAVLNYLRASAERNKTRSNNALKRQINAALKMEEAFKGVNNTRRAAIENNAIATHKRKTVGGKSKTRRRR